MRDTRGDETGVAAAVRLHLREQVDAASDKASREWVSRYRHFSLALDLPGSLGKEFGDPYVARETKLLQ